MAAKAPASIIPSSPMLMTPARSATTSPSAVNSSGIAMVTIEQASAVMREKSIEIMHNAGVRTHNGGRGAAPRSRLDVATAGKLVKIAQAARKLKGHGLDEGISTRLIVYAALLIKGGVSPGDACRMAMLRPITDDADIRATLEHAIDATLA